MDASYALGWKSTTPGCGSHFNLPGANALTVTCNLGRDHIGMHARLRTCNEDCEIIALWNNQGGTFDGIKLLEEAATAKPRESEPA